jgi:fimbrial isopeptide formation D2 family protein/LPXTG-motif cell wall-anchored protein
MKKLLAIVTSLFLGLMCAVPTLAAETGGTLTIENPNPGDTYKVYQLLTGDVEELDGEEVIANTAWGSALENLTSVTSKYDSAQALASALSVMTDEELETFETGLYNEGLASQTPIATLTQSSPSVTLPYGYYLVAEYDMNGDLISSNRFITDMVGDITVYPKTGALTITKQVMGVQSGDWQSATDQLEGSDVTFKITAKLPGNVEAYTSGYDVTFNDTLSAGLTYAGDITYTITNEAGDTVSSGTLTATDIETTDTGTTFEIAMGNVTASPYDAGNDDEITITYKAQVSKDAKTGNLGNPNTVNATYSNNVDDSSSTATTANKTATVFTYKIAVNKTDSKGAALAGAEFTLSKLDSAGAWQAVGTETVNEAGTTFTFTGIDDGTYRLEETTTPEGYNTADPVYFKVTSTFDDSNGSPALKTLTVEQTDASGTVLTAANQTVTFTLDGTMDITTSIVNKKGVTLPKTGVSTAIFLYAGAAALIVIGLMLVLKKRKA